MPEQAKQRARALGADAYAAVLAPVQHTTEARLVAVALLGLLQALSGWLTPSEAVMLNAVGDVNAPLHVAVNWPLVEPVPAQGNGQQVAKWLSRQT